MKKYIWLYTSQQENEHDVHRVQGRVQHVCRVRGIKRKYLEQCGHPAQMPHTIYTPTALAELRYMPTEISNVGGLGYSGTRTGLVPNPANKEMSNYPLEHCAYQWLYLVLKQHLTHIITYTIVESQLQKL